MEFLLRIKMSYKGSHSIEGYFPMWYRHWKDSGGRRAAGNVLTMGTRMPFSGLL